MRTSYPQHIVAPGETARSVAMGKVANPVSVIKNKLIINMK